ncbi:MAG TPA: hypothetical protein VLX85_01990 [Stellaceae bacterium]|nr:hypothetical protein [Stellaceae bacterium]
MRNAFLVAGFLLCCAPAAALAQDAGGGPADSTPGTSLNAYRHHQPSRKDVTERELDRYGKKNVDEKERRTQSELDRLHDEILRDSAPPQARQ